jgi:hypothetical protein
VVGTARASARDGLARTPRLLARRLTMTEPAEPAAGPPAIIFVDDDDDAVDDDEWLEGEAQAQAIAEIAEIEVRIASQARMCAILLGIVCALLVLVALSWCRYGAAIRALLSGQTTRADDGSADRGRSASRDGSEPRRRETSAGAKKDR